ncbi:MAG: energy transducer TonB, partial [Chitinophagaceae bacterium]
LEDAFDYFEKYKQLPVVMIGTKGEYIINEVPPKKSKEVVEEKKVKPLVEHRTRNVGVLADAVHQWPQYPGGADAFMKYLDKLGNEMAEYLPKGISKAYIQVEFIVDKDGVPVNFRVLKGTNDQVYIDELINRMENMGTWKPAMLNEKPVAKKIIQTVNVELP